MRSVLFIATKIHYILLKLYYYYYCYYYFGNKSTIICLYKQCMWLDVSFPLLSTQAPSLSYTFFLRTILNIYLFFSQNLFHLFYRSGLFFVFVHAALCRPSYTLITYTTHILRRIVLVNINSAFMTVFFFALHFRFLFLQNV